MKDIFSNDIHVGAHLHSRRHGKEQTVICIGVIPSFEKHPEYAVFKHDVVDEMPWCLTQEQLNRSQWIIFDETASIAN